MNKVIAAMSSQVSRELMKFLGNVANRLNVGDHVYVVGGAVRNWVLGHPIKDVDVVIDSVALQGKDSEWFAKHLSRMIPVETSLATNQYGVAILTIKGDWYLQGHNMKGEVIEIANARKESYGGSVGKGYKPSEVVPATIHEDLVRRELSFNTLLWRLKDLESGPEKAEILDLTGCGLPDLKSGLMRCPASPDKTFQDDPSRILRMIKFAVRYGFTLTPDTEASLRRNVRSIKNAPHSAISNILLETVLGGPNPTKALQMMDDLGILDVIREMVTENKPFRQAVLNWAENQKFDLFFELLDMGLITDDRLKFLPKEQRSLFRMNVLSMSPLEAETFFEVLRQPSKIFDAPRLMAELGIKPAGMKDLVTKARNLLLADPKLMRTDLTDRLR